MKKTTLMRPLLGLLLAGVTLVPLPQAPAASVVIRGDSAFDGRTLTPPFQAIAAGNYHSLALKADGTLVGWGDNRYGQATANH